MSIEAVSWALNVPLGGNQKVILIGLANHAHPDGTQAFPALDTLARYAHCDRSTVRRNLRKLAEDGWIAEDGHGPKGTTSYALQLGGGNLPRVASEATGGGKSARGGGTAMQPEPSIEPSLEPSIERERAPARAPKFSGKPADEQAWRRTEQILTMFNEEAGKDLQAVTGSGEMSESAKRIYRQVRDHPEIDVAGAWRDIIRRTLASKWWGDGPAGVGVVFGPKVFEENIDRPGTSVGRNGRVNGFASDARPNPEWDAQAAEFIRVQEERHEREAEELDRERAAMRAEMGGWTNGQG